MDFPTLLPWRREFLRLLAASPLLARTSSPGEATIARVEEALCVMDFEPAARKALRPAHWGFLASGVDDDATVKANLNGFQHYQLRPRRLVNVAQADLKTELFGEVWDTPIFLCPVGAQRTFHADGEVAVARAAKAKQTLLVYSNVASCALEEVTRALGRAPWYQLYMPARWAAAEKMIRRAEAAGCTVMVWTVDMFGGRNSESMERLRRADNLKECTLCHESDHGGRLSAPMFEGIAGPVNPPEANWSYIARLKKLTRMKLVIKGIETAEDARLCRENGADGIIVSNHGGRGTETGRATIDILPEVVDAAGAKLPVLVDGGFRRGTDVYKALALGARAVGIGRPYLYGLAAFGEKGVERVLDILRAELAMVMKQCGTPAIAQITRAAVAKTPYGA